LAKADLHTHSLFSDGKLSPTELAKKAKAKGLSLFALTDHDTADGLIEAQEASKELGLQFIYGTEITSDFNGKEAHILAYSFSLKTNELREFLKSQNELRENRIREMLEKLKEMGVTLSFESIKEISGNGSIGRPHLAKAIVNAGYAKNSSEAFSKYIGNYAPAYFKSAHPDFKDVIKVIHRAKGKAILAHPAKNYTDTELNDWIYHGIDGFEMIHPRHPYPLQQKFENLSNQYGLIKTGGSDFHGFYSKDEVYFGVVSINTLIVQNLVTLQKENNG
jgi:3',5'-nucleoside bisphosphate phosphatase